MSLGPLSLSGDSGLGSSYRAAGRACCLDIGARRTLVCQADVPSLSPAGSQGSLEKDFKVMAEDLQAGRLSWPSCGTLGRPGPPLRVWGQQEAQRGQKCFPDSAGRGSVAWSAAPQHSVLQCTHLCVSWAFRCTSWTRGITSAGTSTMAGGSPSKASAMPSTSTCTTAWTCGVTFLSPS